MAGSAAVANCPYPVRSLCPFISDITNSMDYFLAGEDEQQTNRSNDLAGG